jgi:hypothetical protein
MIAKKHRFYTTNEKEGEEMKKKFVVQIVSKEWSTDDTCYRDVENGGFDTRDQAELLIEELIYKVPCYDYRIDERYVR